MRVELEIDYRTCGSERVCVEHRGARFALKSVGDSTQRCSMTVDGRDTIEYRYSVDDRVEWGSKHYIKVASDLSSCYVVDRWQDMPKDRALYTSLFTKSIFRRDNPQESILEVGSIVVGVEAAMVEPSQMLVMVGSSAQLGEWSISKGVKMLDGRYPLWQSPALERSDELLGSEFKFVIIDSLSGDVVAWEEGENRRFPYFKDVMQEAILLNLSAANFNLTPWRGSGVAIPLFSIRGEQSMGVGDFSDLKKMVDWAALTGQRVIQILPINDTTMSHTWEDSYPYNANSIFALHPQYISLKKAGELGDRELQLRYEREGRELNMLPKIDYRSVIELKDNYMRQLYLEIGEQQLEQSDFKIFFERNSYWLEPYALFSFLRDRYATVDSWQWADDAIYSIELQAKYLCSNPKELGYYYFVQYNLHKQLVDAREYAQSKGVVFKGDIPIGVSRNSVDVWVNPELFHLDSQAGAPPDDFSILGQNWGFPTYNWPLMAKDGYSWWSRRFQKMSEYFDAYRIDHILGFFRIWEIPLDAVHGLLGHFSPAMPYSLVELKEQYGFDFDLSQARPAINSWILRELFGERAQQVENTYFDRDDNGQLAFKREYDSQIKVKEAVDDEQLCGGLMSLFCELLFIEDPYQRGYYHPRISAQSSYKYRAMSSCDKERFNRLYNDFYYHRHNEFWYAEAMAKLPTLVGSTEMLTCGEDLGMIPDCVPAVMSSQQILSLEIQRMPKDPALTFGAPSSYPYLAVCTTSTHDMNPIRAWLLEDSELSGRYVREMLSLEYREDSDVPSDICYKIVEQHLRSRAMWTILPLQDWLSIDESVRGADPHSERINVPSNSRHYWRYRMHITVEQLIAECSFNHTLKAMIKSSGR